MRLNEEQLHYLWSTHPHDPIWKREVSERLRGLCENSGTPLGNWLVGKCAMREFSVEDVRELETQLGFDHTLRNMLRSITQRVRKQISAFPLARIAIEVKRAANPINPDIYTAKQLQRSHRLIKALERGLRLDLDLISREARLGLLLLSAAYCGGLMDVAQLKALVAINQDQIEWLAGIPEVRLQLPIRGKAEAESRQWFPDPATLALLIRCSEDMRAIGHLLNQPRQKLECIHELLEAVGVTRHDLPTSLSELLDLFRIQMQLRLPQLLTNFAARRRFVSQSLRPSCWGEMFGQPGLEDSIGPYGDETRPTEVDGKVDALGWLLDLCRRIRLSNPVEPFPPGHEHQHNEALVTAWAQYMIGGTSAYGHEIGRRSIARYVRLLGEALDSQLDGLSVFQLESDALETVYESLLEAQQTDGKRRTLAKAIQEFHVFLQRRYSYPPISPYSLLGIGQHVANVDARVISEDQYQATLCALDTCGLELRTPRLVNAAKLFLILGFRLGLRRNEALKLRLRDLHLPMIPPAECERICRRHPNMRVLSAQELAEQDLPIDLLIRPHAQRGLKTQNSVRRLPLHLLLDPDELALLTSWYQQRQEEEHRESFSEFLFCIPDLRTQWIGEGSLLPAVHATMRAVTGCEFVHYHHLRHSCATWQALKLLGSITGFKPALIFDDLPLTVRWLSDSSRLSRALLSSRGGPTRRIVHIVSAILGHGSPKTSLLHYIHSLPLVMAQAWQWNPRVWLFTAYNVASLARSSLPTAKCESDEGRFGKQQHMLRVIGRIKPLRIRKRSRRSTVSVAVQKLENNWAIDRIRRIESMLAYVSYAENTGRQVNLEWLEFSPEDRGMMLDRARYIRDLRQSSHTGSARKSEAASKHRLSPSSHAGDEPVASLLPMPPKHGGRDAVADYAQRLYELFEGPESGRANRTIDYFVEHCWSTDTTLRFYRDRDEEQAKDYLWLLELMGIPPRAIELIIFDSERPKSTKSYWRQQLGKIRSPISLHKPENPVVDNVHLGIRATLEVKDEQRQNHHSGAAIRYLFLMASIDWHFRT